MSDHFWFHFLCLVCVHDRNKDKAERRKKQSASKRVADDVAAVPVVRGSSDVIVDESKIEYLAMLNPDFPRELLHGMLQKHNNNLEVVAEMLFEPGCEERERTRQRRAKQAVAEAQEKAAKERQVETECQVCFVLLHCT